MKTEQNAENLGNLAEALANLTSKFELRYVQPAAAVVMERVKDVSEEVLTTKLVESRVVLEGADESLAKVPQRLQAYVNLLKLPFMIGDAQKCSL